MESADYETAATVFPKPLHRPALPRHRTPLAAASRVRRIEIPEFVPHHLRPLNDQILDSGMPLIPEMAAYNVALL